MTPILAAAVLLVTTAGDPAFRGGWAADGAWIAAGLALQRGSVVIERSVNTPDCPCDRGRVPSFDRWAIGRDRKDAARDSDAGRDLLVFGAPLAAGLAVPGTGETRVHAALVVAESVLVTRGVTSVLKASFQRPRPNAYADEGGPLGPGTYHSMPSGHTSSSFAAATGLVTVLTQRRPGCRATPWIAAGAYATAVTVGFLRVDAGRHFPSDVVAGAALGTSVGWAVARSRELPDVVLAPAPDGVSVLVRF